MISYIYNNNNIKKKNLGWLPPPFWPRDLILVQHQYNNCTTLPYMRVGPSMWNPPSCERLLYNYCIGVVNLTFSFGQGVAQGTIFDTLSNHMGHIIKFIKPQGYIWKKIVFK